MRLFSYWLTVVYLTLGLGSAMAGPAREARAQYHRRCYLLVVEKPAPVRHPLPPDKPKSSFITQRTHGGRSTER
jgi:hypothetical protein